MTVRDTDDEDDGKKYPGRCSHTHGERQRQEQPVCRLRQLQLSDIVRYVTDSYLQHTRPGASVSKCDYRYRYFIIIIIIIIIIIVISDGTRGGSWSTDLDPGLLDTCKFGEFYGGGRR